MSGHSCFDCGRTGCRLYAIFVLNTILGLCLRVSQIRCYKCALADSKNKTWRIKISDDYGYYTAPYMYGALDQDATLLQWNVMPATAQEWDRWLALPPSGEGGDEMTPEDWKAVFA